MLLIGRSCHERLEIAVQVLPRLLGVPPDFLSAACALYFPETMFVAAVCDSVHWRPIETFADFIEKPAEEARNEALSTSDSLSTRPRAAEVVAARASSDIVVQTSLAAS